MRLLLPFHTIHMYGPFIRIVIIDYFQFFRILSEIMQIDFAAIAVLFNIYLIFFVNAGTIGSRIRTDGSRVMVY